MNQPRPNRSTKVPKDIAESILHEVNNILKEKGIFIDSNFDYDQEDYDFKLELNLR